MKMPAQYPVPDARLRQPRRKRVPSDHLPMVIKKVAADVLLLHFRRRLPAIRINVSGRARGVEEAVPRGRRSVPMLWVSQCV